MSGVRISDLPSVASSMLADIFPIDQGGTTSKESLSQVATLFNSTLTFLPLSGGTLTGSLILSGLPVSPLEAATKSYVDSLSFTLQNVYDSGDGSILETGTKPFVLKDKTATGDNTTIFDVFSTTRGSRPFPTMTQAQLTLIGSPAPMLFSATSDHNLLEYYDGTQYQQMLTVGHVLAGTNMGIVNNGDGTITLSSSGGGGGGSNSDYAGFSGILNAFATVIATINTYTPISLNPATFQNITSSNFVNEIATISGVATPCFRYTDATTQNFLVNFNLNVVGGVPTQQTYIFQVYIYTAGGSVVATNFISSVVLQDLIFPWDQSLTALVSLSTGDRVFIQVKNITSTNSFVVQYINASIVNINASGSVDLQAAYTASSNGVILETGTKPFTLSNTAGVGDNSTLLDMLSTTLGSRPYPTMTSSQFMSIGSPATGLISFTSDNGHISLYDGTSYKQLAYTSDNGRFIDVTTPTQVMVSNTTYLADNPTQVTFTLPASSAVNDYLRIIGFGAGGYVVNQITSSQQIFDSAASSTLGITGSLTIGSPADSVWLVCINSSGVWSVVNSNGTVILN